MSPWSPEEMLDAIEQTHFHVCVELEPTQHNGAGAGYCYCYLEKLWRKVDALAREKSPRAKALKE